MEGPIKAGDSSETLLCSYAYSDRGKLFITGENWDKKSQFYAGEGGIITEQI